MQCIVIIQCDLREVFCMVISPWKGAIIMERKPFTPYHRYMLRLLSYFCDWKFCRSTDRQTDIRVFSFIVVPLALYVCTLVCYWHKSSYHYKLCFCQSGYSAVCPCMHRWQSNSYVCMYVTKQPFKWGFNSLSLPVCS